MVWRSGNGNGRINKGTLRQVWLVQGLVIIFWRVNQPSWPTQPPTHCGMGNEYHPKCGDALWLGCKGRMAHSICR